MNEEERAELERLRAENLLLFQRAKHAEEEVQALEKMLADANTEAWQAREDLKDANIEITHLRRGGF